MNTMHAQVPRFATCSFDECTRPGVRGSSCATCKRHICAKHQARRFHKCPRDSELDDVAWEKAINDEVSGLMAQVNTSALAKEASCLNSNKPCTFHPGKHIGSGAIMGCANYHGWLIFEDGERWMARIPRTSSFSDLPPDLVEYFVASEYATLKFLESTNIPAPRAFGFGLASDQMNPVGVSYLIVDALPGEPYQSHTATAAQAQHVLEQVAGFQIELSRRPFTKAGSLSLETSGDNPDTEVGPMASNRSLHLGRIGPFDTADGYFKMIAAQYLDLIADGQLHHQCPLEAYLFYTLLQSRATAKLAKDGEFSSSNDRDAPGPEQFFLKHVDDKGDHILVDDQFNVVGIIDWQFARTVPAREAFGPSLLTADLEGLYSKKGAGGPSQDDGVLAGAFRQKGAEALARLAEGNDLVRRFQFGLPTSASKNDAREMIAGVLACCGEQQDTDVEVWVRDQVCQFEETAAGRELLSKLRGLEALQRQGI